MLQYEDVLSVSAAHHRVIWISAGIPLIKLTLDHFGG